MLTARRRPGSASVSFCRWLWRPRMRPRSWEGTSSTSWADGESAVDEGAGYDGTEARHGKRAVDGQAGAAQVRSGGSVGENVVHFLEERVEALAGLGGKGDDGGVFKDGALEGFDCFHLGEFQEVFVDEVGLGEGDETPSDIEQVEDGEVFACLGHDAFIGGHHQ